MNEIKFRAWDKEYEVMTDWFWLNSEGKTYETPVTVCDTPHLEIERNDDLIVMQYTGLKDKNGVEIYVGDMVVGRLYNHGVSGWEYETKVVINDFSDIYELDNNSEEIEVIGNIYEDKLVEEQNK